jgi:uncharacterized protein (TIGR02145 family)
MIIPRFLSIIACLVIASTLQAQKKLKSRSDPFASTSVKIGTQVWMNKNLDVSRFRNLDPIPEVLTNEEWQKALDEKKPAWCYYNFDSSNGKKFGKMYNWYAVNDPRGFAPAGWHIPNFKEWDLLFSLLGGLDKAWDKLVLSTGWMEGMRKTSNESGFSALGGGGQNSSGSNGIGIMTLFWSVANDNSSIDKNSNVKVIQLYLGDVTPVFGMEKSGMYVRCVKDL